MSSVSDSFVGRVDELRALGQVVGGTVRGSLSIAVLHGPAGIGKTALIREALRREPKVGTIWTAGVETERLLPFSALDRIWAARGKRRPHVPGSRSGGLGAGAQLLELLSTVVADQALVVVVDDAHWVDSLSAEAVAFALRRMVSERALVIVSWRDEEEGTVPPALRRLAAEGPEGPGRARIGLAGLSDDDVRQLGVAGGHPELTRVTAQLLQRQTNGNPLYVRALLEELSRETLAGTAAGSLPAPRSYSSFVGSNLAHCGADAGALAKAAAVVGDRLPLARSVQLSGLDWPRAGAALDRLSEAGLVTLTPILASGRGARPS